MYFKVTTAQGASLISCNFLQLFIQNCVDLMTEEKAGLYCRMCVHSIEIFITFVLREPNFHTNLNIHDSTFFQSEICIFEN